MPGWSPEVANELIRLAEAEDRWLDQLQLQALVYIAHGWRLALSNEPLTGDRPEAWDYGPMYRRLADALATYGRSPVTGAIPDEQPVLAAYKTRLEPALSKLDEMEVEFIAEIYQNYSRFEWSQLATIIAGDGSPWQQVLRSEAGKFRDIPHHLVKAQFVALLRNADGWRAKG